MAKFKWDVKIGDRIRHFDPTLTYEVTKYRPITETQGLDFDKTPFIEAGLRKDTTGVYTTMPRGTKTHKDWWTEEMRRCKEGFEHNGYRITGDHYFFLNYYSLQKLTNVTKAGEGRDVGRPDFWSKHYEYFHYIEICEILGKDVIAFKSRGVGFSEIAVCLGVRPYTTTKNYSAVYIAFSDGLLEPTLSKVWDQLEWLNQETEGAFKRIRQKIDTNMRKRASTVNSEKMESGHMAELQGIVVDNSRKLRGRRIDRLVFEESGSNPILTETYNKGQALVELVGKKIGTRIVFGTGGDTGPALAGLEKMFLNPETFNGLPYRHNYTTDGQYILTGFFLPAFSCVVDYLDEETNTRVPCMDHRGVTDQTRAKAYYERKRVELRPFPQELMDYCAEYCFFPEEALSKQGQNDFNQARLAQQYTDIKVLKIVPEPERGRFFWEYESGNSDTIVGVKWVPDTYATKTPGEVFITEHPMTEETDFGLMPIKNLYCAGTDSIDHGQEDSVVGDKGSKFAITVKKRRFGTSGDRYVCKYIERPQDVRIAYTTAAQILWYYGCKTNLEDTKISFRTWLREKKLDKRFLMQRPNFALAEGKRNDNLWGTPGSEKMIRHGLALVKDHIEDFCQNIWFIDMVIQLQKFSYEAKGLFDIVMAMVYTEIADEDMYDLKIQKPDLINKTWRNVGWFINDKGYKEFGEIPGQDNLNPNIFGKQLYEMQ